VSAPQKTLGEITEARVEQTGPSGQEFTYVDIGSVELNTKRIVGPKVLPSSEAPSRAKQVLKQGDVLVSMTRPNRNAVALVTSELDGAIGSTGFHVLRAKDAEPGFIFYTVQTNDFMVSQNAIPSRKHLGGSLDKAALSLMGKVGEILGEEIETA